MSETSQVETSDPKRLSVVGLGYVGLPVAVAFAEAGHHVIGYDTNSQRVAALKAGRDNTRSVTPAALESPRLTITDDAAALREADIHIVAVPTPIDDTKQPDLSALGAASETVGKSLKHGDIVVYESTVFPGATREFAVPILERVSGLSFHKDFAVGYSPERINPGDSAHQFRTICKVVAASSETALETITALYQSAIEPKIFQASSIEVAEAAKVIENTQRDLNIALMNELAELFHTLDIDTRDVIDAAATKWNFLPFQPGLVGGHCIGVDPYYLTHKALQVGHSPKVVLAGRDTNEAMAHFVASAAIRECVSMGKSPPLAVLVLGVTYKADVPDMRNSKVLDLISELSKYGATVTAHDPLADVTSASSSAPANLEDRTSLGTYDAVVLAVAHQDFLSDGGWPMITSLLTDGKGLVMDLPAALDRSTKPTGVSLWRL